MVNIRKKGLPIPLGQRCEEVAMLVRQKAVLSDFDELVFKTFVPEDHYLRQVAAVIDFEKFWPRLAAAYSADKGRPPVDPVRMLKIEFLRYQYGLSDRQVMERTVGDMPFRWFLDMNSNQEVPNHT